MDLVTYLFFVVVFILLVATLAFLLMLGLGRLESSIGIYSDGIRAGDPAPSWSLPDISGTLRGTPTHARWQFLIFADTILGAFPSLVAGIQAFVQEDEVDILVHSRDNTEFCRAVARSLQLSVPIVSVDDHFYRRFRVRVVPFGTLVDPAGVVRWSGLINTEEQMRHIWQTIRRIEHELVAG